MKTHGIDRPVHKHFSGRGASLSGGEADVPKIRLRERQGPLSCFGWCENDGKQECVDIQSWWGETQKLTFEAFSPDIDVPAG